MLGTDRILYVNGLKPKSKEKSEALRLKKGLTDARFHIVLAMLTEDPELCRRVWALLRWFRPEP